MRAHLPFPITAMLCCGLLMGCGSSTARPTPTPAPPPTASASPSLTPNPTATPSPSPTPAVIDIALPDIGSIPQIGKPILVVPWGRGKCEVGIAGPRINFKTHGRALGPTFGPSVMDVAPDGTIALVDMGHDRLLFIDPASGKCEPFTQAGKGLIDVDFDDKGRLAVFVGEYTGINGSGEANIPYLLVYSQDRQLELAAPVYTEVIATFEQGWGIPQPSGAVLYPLDEDGQPRSREQQIANLRPPDLQPLDIDGRYMQLADRPQGQTFTLHDPSGTPGFLLGFERLSDIYIAVFHLILPGPIEKMRVVRFDAQGEVLQDMQGTWHDSYGVMTTYGQVAVDGAGNVYVLEDSQAGAEIYRAHGS